MADEIKVLGQVYGNGSEQALYTVPDKTTDTVAANILTQVTCSSLVVCNQTAAPLTFRVSISLAGAATASKDYLFYDAPLAGNSTMAAVLGITMQQTDVVRVDGAAGLSFTLMGVETY